MSDQPNETTSTELPGASTATDVGGVTGTQADATEDNKPSDPSAASPLHQHSGETSPDADAQIETEKKPGQPVGDEAPKLAELEGHLCPNCHVGVLEVVRYDPKASHEDGQGKALESGKESGGGYEVRCRHCTFSESRAFNPGDRWGRS